MQGPEGRDGIPGINGLPGPPGHVFVIPVSCAGRAGHSDWERERQLSCLGRGRLNMINSISRERLIKQIMNSFA